MRGIITMLVAVLMATNIAWAQTENDESTIYLNGNKESSVTSKDGRMQLKLNGMSRRCDTVVYDRTLKPRIIVEYKSPTVNITQQVFEQICRYNIVLQVDYLIVSNGLSHYCCQVDHSARTYTFLKEIPEYSKVVEP